MREKVEFSQMTGLDLQGNNAIDRKAFMNWLIANHQPMGQDHARNLAYCANAMLRQLDTSSISEQQAEALAAQILLSKWSKSNKRIKLIALEYWMQFIGKPIHFKKPQETKRNLRYLTEQQMSQLIRASRNYRDAAILELLCTTGLRVGELRLLNLEDLDFNNAVIHVRHGKGDREREVFLTDECKAVLESYIIKWKVLGGPLFCSSRATRISIHAVQAIARSAAMQAGLPYTTPHMLRHSYATCFAGKNDNVFILQELLGHSTIEMTRRYYHSNREVKRKGAMIGAPTMLTHG